MTTRERQKSKATDPATRSEAETVLLDSQALLSAVIGATTDAIYVKDVRGRYLIINQAACRIVGKEAHELIGRDDTALFSPDDAREVMAGDRRVVESGGPQTYEEHVTIGDGTQHWYLSTKGPIYEADGTAMGLYGVARDITDRKRAEEEMARTLSLLVSTTESTADALLVTDGKGSIVSFNSQFVRMWNIPEAIIASRDDDDAIGFELQQLVDPDTFLRIVRELYDAPDKSSFDTLEFKDGRIIERYSQPQRIGDAIVGRVWSFRDATERKNAEKQVAEQLNELLRWQDVLLDREDRVYELKREINELCGRLGEPVRYPSAAGASISRRE